jgi:4-amino-4-deoxy-L-arabinose transferase-like glycosyltransferase
MRMARAALCAILAAILYLPALGGPALLEPDEGRYAEIAREMVVSRDYVTPRDDWVRYFEKPPLVYWLTAGSIRLFGANEFAVRLPAAILSIGQVATTEIIGETMFGATAGLFAATALALSPLFFGFARFATLDPALAFFMTAALGLFYFAVEAIDPRSRTSRYLLIAAAIMLAFGTLAKGPVAIVLAGAIALSFMLIERRAREIPRFPWLASVAIYAAIVVPWFALAAARNPGFLKFFFLHEHVARYLESSEHGWGPYFLIVVAAAGTWPWLYFAISGAADLWRERQSSVTRARDPLAFLLVWFIVVLIFFSIPRSKLGSYILPGLPPIAILAGLGMANFLRERRSRRFIGWFAALNLVIAIGFATALASFVHRLEPAIIIDGAIIVAALMIIGTGPLVIAWRSRGIAIATIVAGVLLCCAIGMKLRCDSAALYSYRRLARAVAPALGSGCLLVSYRHFVQSLPFYTGHREGLVDFRGELAPFSYGSGASASFIPNLARLEHLWKSTTCVVAIVNFRDLPEVSARLGSVSFLGCEGKKAAVSNRPGSAPPVRFDCRGEPPNWMEGAELGLRRRGK